VLGSVVQAVVWCGLLALMVRYPIILKDPLKEGLLLLTVLCLTSSVQSMARALIVDAVARHVRGLPPDPGSGFGRMLTILPDLLGVAAIGTAVRFMARRGAMLQAWGTSSFFVVPVLVLEQQTFSDSLSRAQTLQSEKVLPVRLDSIGVSNTTAIFSLLLVGSWMMLYLLTYRSSPDMTEWQLLAWLVLGLGAFVASNAVAAVAEGVYCACMYLWAREVERDPKAESVRIPDLVVQVLKRRGDVDAE
jgi:hypothetical protein